MTGGGGGRAGRRHGYGMLLAAVVLFSTVEVLTKWIGPAMPPLRMAGLRFLVCAAVLAAPALGEYRRRGRRWSRRDALLFAGLGAVGVTAAIGLFHVAITYLPANVSAVVFSGNPVFVVFLAPMLLREPMTRRKAAAVVIGLLGIAAFARYDGTWSARAATGLLLMLGSVAAFALYTVMSKRCIPVYGAVPITAFASLAGSLLLLGLSWAAEGRPWAACSARAWGGVLYLGVAGTACAYVLYFAGLHRVEASRGSLLFFLKPWVASLLAWRLLGEGVTPAMWAGGSLVLASLLVALGPTRPAAARPGAG